MSALALHPIGVEVIIAPGVTATIIGVTIAPGPCVLYRVMWWHDGSRKEETVYDFECKGAEPTWQLEMRT